MMLIKCIPVVLFIILCCSTNFTNSNIIENIACKFYECCNKPYISLNFSSLEQNLKENLYGQPLVINTTVNALKAHYNLNNPSKALVLSFHGVTGSGKNFVSEFIAKSLFQKGLESKFYKYFSATRDFPHNEQLSGYKTRLISTIEETVKKCEVSLFIFDEMDKLPIGLMDTIKPYIDFVREIDGTDFRRSTFIFLSNTASKVIAEQTLNLNQKNQDRNSFELKAFQNVIHDTMYKQKSTNDKGMWHSSLITSHLIDHYVPFLPLERQHIKQCIAREFNKNSITFDNYDQFSHDVNFIADEMVYDAAGDYKYASSGCKRVANFVRKRIIEKGLKTHSKSEF